MKERKAHEGFSGAVPACEKEREKVLRSRERVYDGAVKGPLIKVWEVMDYPCGKRLAPMMGEVLKNLRRYGRIRIASGVEAKLCGMSAATIDRLLVAEAI